MSPLFLMYLCAAVIAIVLIVFIARVDDQMSSLADDYSDAVHRGDTLTARLKLRMIYSCNELRKQRLLLIATLAPAVAYPVLYQSPAIGAFIAVQLALGGYVLYRDKTADRRIDDALRDVYAGAGDIDPDDVGATADYESSIIDHSEIVERPVRGDVGGSGQR